MEQRTVLELPRWVPEFMSRRPRFFPTALSRERLVVALARRNVEARTGGPFGAAVFESRSGRLLAVGVNRVEPLGCCLAHAEVMAILLAQKTLGTYDLDARGLPKHELVTSAQPCLMCLGAALWSGVTRLVFLADRHDVESIVGFDEGPVPARWRERLARRGVVAVQGRLRDQARAVLQRYVANKGTVYQRRTKLGKRRPSR